VTKGADDRGGRPPESAAFEPERLGGPRHARLPIAPAGFVVVLVAVVAVGLSGRLGAGTFPKDVAIGPTGEPTPAQSAFDRPVVPAAPGRGFASFAPDAGPIVTSEPGPMAVSAQRQTQGIFVHGDLHAAKITWVYVGVLDDAGRVAGWTSVSVPGAAGPNGKGPTLRFDVELAVPSDFQGRLWVRAHAYDADGKVVASANVEIPAPAQ
jgi:hypothetical protein